MGKHLFRSSPPPEKPTAHHSLAESAVEECMSSINSVISKWTSSSDEFLFSTNSRLEAEEFVRAVRDLQSTMHRLVSVNPSSGKLVYAQNLMQSAMNLLESEFHRVLKANQEYLDPESVSVRTCRSSRFSSSTTPTVVSDSEDESSLEEFGNADDHRFSGGDTDAMDDLKMIADCMISTGYAKECVSVYKTVRRSIVDETLHNLAVERFTLHQIQKMDWEILDSKIKSWLKAVKLAVRSLFFGERLLADHVFSSSGPIVESSFTEITQEGALILFTFPENAAKIKKLTPEKMFRYLDMYEALANLYVEIESIFYFDSAAAVRTQVINSLARLGDAVRSMMTDFESAIQKETSKTLIIGGGVHPLTRYVMNYLSFLADYSESIAAIFENWQLKVPSPLPDSLFISSGDDAHPEDDYSSPVSVRIAWVILLTLCKIDGKAQPYKDVALSYLFLANNLQYVVVKVRSSNLRLLLGDDWMMRHEEKVNQYADKFEKLAWGKVLASLPEDPTEDISPEEARDLYARFNDEFEASYRKQTSWVIPDPKLRDRIKISLSQKLLRVCTEFYRINRANLVGDAYNESIVRYTPEDLGNYLSDLYFGSRGSGSVSTKGSGSGAGSSTTGKSCAGRSH